MSIPEINPRSAAIQPRCERLLVFKAPANPSPSAHHDPREAFGSAGASCPPAHCRPTSPYTLYPTYSPAVIASSQFLTVPKAGSCAAAGRALPNSPPTPQSEFS